MCFSPVMAQLMLLAILYYIIVVINESCQLHWCPESWLPRYLQWCHTHTQKIFFFYIICKKWFLWNQMNSDGVAHWTDRSIDNRSGTTANRNGVIYSIPFQNPNTHCNSQQNMVVPISKKENVFSFSFRIHCKLFHWMIYGP